MKLLLLGATGRAGGRVLKQALDSGYEVTCLVRNPQKVISSSEVTIIQGDPKSRNDLEGVMKGVDLLISVLNISRKSDFPWAPLRTPKTYMSTVVSNIISLSKKHPLKRVVICSAWGVLETKKDIPFWFRWMIDMSNIGVAYKDHERQEKLMESSGLDWTIVRPVGLTNGTKKQQVRESFNNDPKPSITINRSTVASYLLDSLHKDELIGKKVVISKD